MILKCNVIGHYNENPIYVVIGFFLTIFIIVLASRERIRKRKYPEKYYSKVVDENYIQEKDVLGLDKTYINCNEPDFKTANKSKLKYVIFIFLFILGLLMMLLGTQKREGAYGGSVSGGNIHHPNDKNDWSYNPFNWFYSNENIQIVDTLFPPVFQEKDLYKKTKELQDSVNPK